MVFSTKGISFLGNLSGCVPIFAEDFMRHQQKSNETLQTKFNHGAPTPAPTSNKGPIFRKKSILILHFSKSKWSEE
jgi:hypothetical protein